MKAGRAKKERKKERKRKKMDNFVSPSMAFVIKGIEGERMEWNGKERNILLLVRFVQDFEKNNNNSHLSFVYIYNKK